jgi:hypothetical protein
MAALILIRELCPHCRAAQIILTDILDDSSESILHPVRWIKCAEIFLVEAPERTVIEGPYSD